MIGVPRLPRLNGETSTIFASQVSENLGVIGEGDDIGDAENRCDSYDERYVGDGVTGYSRGTRSSMVMVWDLTRSDLRVDLLLSPTKASRKRPAIGLDSLLEDLRRARVERSEFAMMEGAPDDGGRRDEDSDERPDAMDSGTLRTSLTISSS